MADEQTASLEGQAVESASQGTGASEEQSGTQAQQFTEADYKELQATYTRTQQEKKELEQAWQNLNDPELQGEALKTYFGIELQTPEPEPEPTYTDPDDELRKKVDELAQWRTDREAQEQQVKQVEQDAVYIDQQFTGLEEKTGVKLTPKQTEVLGQFAFANRDDRGRPNATLAWELFQEATAVEKPKPKAAQVPAGQPAGERPDLSTHQKRMEKAARELAALEAD